MYLTMQEASFTNITCRLPVLEGSKVGSAQILKVDPHQKFTVLGSCSTPRKVDQIWIVESSQNTQSGSLVDRAKQRMNTRASPSFLHYEQGG